MSKYILDIPDGVEWGVVTCRTEDGFYTRDFDSLEELNSDYINEHYGSLQDDAYQKGFEDGKAVREKGCEGCRYTVMGSDTTICSQCCNAYYNQWTAKETNYDIIRNGIQNWVTELNVKAEDIQKILEDMKA